MTNSSAITVLVKEILPSVLRKAIQGNVLLLYQK